MAPIKAGKYEFRPESLVEVRQNLALSQDGRAIGGSRQHSVALGNRCHNARCRIPDSIYSVAMEQGVTPKFFHRKRPAPKPFKQRSRLLVMWDFQNLGVSATQVASVDTGIRDELERRFKGASYRRFKAFSYSSQWVAGDELQRVGWRLWEDDVDMDNKLINQARSDCGQDPKETILVLITRDGGFVGLINDLHQLGAEIYVLAPSNESNQDLLKAVGKKHWINLAAPFSVGFQSTVMEAFPLRW